MIRHHLNDELLMAYSAGTLPEAFSLVVAAHVSLCDTCRARLEGFDAVGGAVLDGIGDGIDLSAGALEATMARIAAMERDGAPAVPRPAARRNAVLPGPLRDYVGGDLEAVRWRPVGGGVRQAILPTSESASVRLLHIPAGTAVPDHSHGGLELTLVLQGAFRDEHDRFGPGDVEIATPDVHHTPVAEPGPDCICLAATDAPLRFSGWLPRLAQPFVKI
ncbi:MAG: cupin domain-containing protein [Rhodobacteraceae bacterium]|nr:cupin domain-containing protein [Paracoccaceae bacterium]